MKRLWFVAALCLAAGCGGGAKPRLNGAGSTFVFPMMSKWAAEYDKAKSVEVNYQTIGSGGGIQQMTAKSADFGCTDGPMNDEQLHQARQSGGEVVHIPLVLGAIVPAYNLPDLKQSLRFSGPALADIFLGKIHRWDDAVLRDLNPGVALPDKEITVIHRSDGGGTTYVWVDYLAKVSPEWKRYVGVGTGRLAGRRVREGRDGVAGRMKDSPGAIGYVEMLYALQNNIPFGRVRNREGAFIEAGPQSVRAAAENCLAERPRTYASPSPTPPAKAPTPLAERAGQWSTPIGLETKVLGCSIFCGGVHTKGKLTPRNLATSPFHQAWKAAWTGS